MAKSLFSFIVGKNAEGMDTLDAAWGWLLQFAKGDLPCWITVVITVIGVLLVIRFRKQPIHSELNLSRLHFDDDGGPIILELEFTTYSHASRLDARAKLKLDGVKYPMKLEPV